jgi:hypothetical protein
LLLAAAAAGCCADRYSICADVQQTLHSTYSMFGESLRRTAARAPARIISERQRVRRQEFSSTERQRGSRKKSSSLVAQSTFARSAGPQPLFYRIFLMVCIQSIACSIYVSHEFVAYVSEKNSLSDYRGPSEDDRGPQNFCEFTIYSRWSRWSQRLVTIFPYFLPCKCAWIKRFGCCKNISECIGCSVCCSQFANFLVFRGKSGFPLCYASDGLLLVGHVATSASTLRSSGWCGIVYCKVHSLGNLQCTVTFKDTSRGTISLVFVCVYVYDREIRGSLGSIHYLCELRWDGAFEPY